MCLILFAWGMDEDFPLVLAANRDEFYERPSAPAAFFYQIPMGYVEAGLRTDNLFEPFLEDATAG